MTKLKLIFAIIFSIVILLTFAGIYYYYEYIVPKPYGYNEATVYVVANDGIYANYGYELHFDNSIQNKDIYYKDCFGIGKNMSYSNLRFSEDISPLIFTNSFGNILEVIYKHGNDYWYSLKFKYYQDGYLSEFIETRKKDSIIFIKDNDNKLVKYVWFRDNQEISTINFKYNTNGFINSFHDDQNTFSATTVYSDNNLLKKVIFNNYGQHQPSTNLYEYDNQNRVIKETSFNNSLNELIEYNIEYYPDGKIKKIKFIQEGEIGVYKYSNDLISDIYTYKIDKYNDMIEKYKLMYIYKYKIK